MDETLDRLKHALRARYQIDRVLGQGGMALVFLADDARHDRRVAVKVLRPELGSEVGAERFLREIKLAARLTHPHILPLYDSGEADGLLFYVMPYIDGESLRQRLDRQGPLSIDETLSIAVAVGAALEYAHRQGVVHRDIKPENILIHDAGALVADFGIGKALTTATEGALTQTGAAMGTPAYMSPEQASGETELDGRSDQYSLGCMVYEMLGGEPPFSGPNVQAIIARRLIDTAPRLRALRDVPEPIDAAVARALSRTPIDRFATVGDFVQALETPTDVGAARGRQAGHSIAVLPFANMSADPENEYFSDGMTEEIINALVKVKELKVASRTSSFAYKGKVLDVREIGEKLGVASVLEGSVRKAGNRIRITAQLIDVANGYHRWSETYDRHLEDVFAIQDEISRAIVEALRVTLTGEEESAPLVSPGTEDLEAYTLYLKGRFYFNRFTELDLRRSLEMYAEALRRDASYARAHAGISDTWMNLADDWLPPREAYPKAKEAAQRAIELDTTLAEARTSLGKIIGWYDWDFSEAERELREVIDRSPGYAEGWFGLASILPPTGRLDEAVDAMRRAFQEDPHSAGYSRWLARLLVFAGEYDEAIQLTRRTLELDPAYSRAYLDLGNAYLAQGEAEKALAAYRKGQIIEGSVISFNASTARALAAMDKEDEVFQTVGELESLSEERYIRAEVIAAGYAAIGKIDDAFRWLGRGLEERSAGLIYLAVDLAYKPLWDDPRFGELTKEIGLTVLPRS